MVWGLGMLPDFSRLQTPPQYPLDLNLFGGSLTAPAGLDEVWARAPVQGRVSGVELGSRVWGLGCRECRDQRHGRSDGASPRTCFLGGFLQ